MARSREETIKNLDEIDAMIKRRRDALPMDHPAHAVYFKLAEISGSVRALTERSDPTPDADTP